MHYKNGLKTTIYIYNGIKETILRFRKKNSKQISSPMFPLFIPSLHFPAPAVASFATAAAASRGHRGGRPLRPAVRWLPNCRRVIGVSTVRTGRLRTVGGQQTK